MSIKIITDSGADLPQALIDKHKISVIPLEVLIDDETYLDGVDLSCEEFYKKMNESDTLPKTASPSPQKFLEQFKGSEKNIFVITISSKLSSTYNNAILAKSLYEKENNNKNIYVIDSLSASVGEGMVVLKLVELIYNNMDIEEAVSQTNKFAKENQVYFLLETLDNIIKGGRIGKAAGFTASLLSIRLILKSDSNGAVDLAEKVRGSKRAFKRLVDIVGEECINPEERTLAIAHANCYEKAIVYKELIEEKYNFKDIIISTIGPTIGTYSGEGGLLISFL